MGADAERRAAWRSNPANLEKDRQANRRWRANLTEEQVEARNTNNRAWHAKPENKERRRDKRWGFKPGEYDALLEKQGNACAGCRRPADEVVMHTDHDHACCPGQTSCGKCVRGLLCSDCNRALGYVRDNPDTLSRLAAYLSKA